MLKRIAITGPESTGKSWLAEHLAADYKAVWVAEYAREYLNGIMLPYNIQDIEHIAVAQHMLIEAAALKATNYIFADTEALVCDIWAKFVFGTEPESIRQLLQNQHFDLYLLCDIDLPWEPDPLREHPDERKILFDLYKDTLEQLGCPYAIISGEGNERLLNAVNAINQLQ
ncbi:MAG: ATP-binding protein [Bacteroidetes bacterium]|nr:ATP-binding protein [Bacteroidota bacterium]